MYDIVYKGNNAFFEKYYLNQNFIDCDGNIFKIIGKSDMKQSLFFWNKKRFQLEFEILNKKMNLDELQKMLLERSKQIKEPAAYKTLQEQIEKSTTIEELLRGRID